MPYVPLIPVGRIVMTWIWSFSCDVIMKHILKFVGPFFFSSSSTSSPPGIVWLYTQMLIWQP
jgi:hypothetical protein